MPWVLARTTDDLTDDPDWDGQLVGSNDGPPASIFFPVGVRQGAQVHGERWITIRIGFVDDAGLSVPSAGTCTAEPVSADRLPLPSPSDEQSQLVASVGTALVDTAAWSPEAIEIQPRGLWTVRLSGMANASATRACVWYWAHPY